MRALLPFATLLLLHTAQAQPFHHVYGAANIAHPAFAASLQAYYLAHGSDAELFKTGFDGQVIWSRTMQYNGSAVPIYRMAFLNDQLMVSGGHAAQQNFFAALDTDGNVLWSSAANFGDIHLPTRIHATSGGYLTVGHREYPTGGGWTFDFTLCQWDASGTLLWAKAFGDDTYDYFGWTSVVLPGGDILLAGERKNANGSKPMLARFNSSGDLLWMKLLSDGATFFTHTSPTDLVALSDGHFALVATTSNTFVNNDAHVMKFDGDGHVLWAHRLYQVGWTEMGGSILEDAGYILVSGQHSEGNATGAHVARFTLEGTPADVKTLPYYRSPSASGYYTGLGQDLVSFGQWQYALAGECTAALGQPSWHGLSIFNFTNEPVCGATTPYPFQYATVTWNDSLITDATVATNITAVPVTLTCVALTTTSADLCSLVPVEPVHPANPLRLYPNPGSTSCTLSLPRPPSGPVRICDAAGRMLAVPLRWNTAQEALLELGALAPGVYAVRVEMEGSTQAVRLVKE